MMSGGQALIQYDGVLIRRERWDRHARGGRSEAKKSSRLSLGPGHPENQSFPRGSQKERTLQHLIPASRT